MGHDSKNYQAIRHAFRLRGAGIVIREIRACAGDRYPLILVHPQEHPIADRYDPQEDIKTAILPNPTLTRFLKAGRVYQQERVLEHERLKDPQLTINTVVTAPFQAREEVHSDLLSLVRRLHYWLRTTFWRGE